MRRRRFSTMLTAAIAGLASGSRIVAQQSPALTTTKAPKHVCQGLNACKGKGGYEVPLKIEHTQARKGARKK